MQIRCDHPFHSFTPISFHNFPSADLPQTVWHATPFPPSKDGQAHDHRIPEVEKSHKNVPETAQTLAKRTSTTKKSAQRNRRFLCTDVATIS